VILAPCLGTLGEAVSKRQQDRLPLKDFWELRPAELLMIDVASCASHARESQGTKHQNIKTMNTTHKVIVSALAMGLIAIGSSLHAQDTKVRKDQDLVDHIRQPDLPKVSTTTTRTAASISAQENKAEAARQKETSARYPLDRGNVPSPVVHTSTTTAVSTSTSTAKSPATNTVNTSTSTAKAPATTAVSTSTSTAKAPDKPKK